MATEFRYTPEEFDKLVKAYHNNVEVKQNEFPDLAGLKNILTLENEEYDAMAADPRYHATCLWAMRRRESFLNRAALKVKNTTGIKMLFAQPENGGYVDKPIDKTPRQIEVTLRGMSNEAVSFDDSDGADDDSDSDDRIETGKADNNAPDTADKPVRKPRRTKKQA